MMRKIKGRYSRIRALCHGKSRFGLLKRFREGVKKHVEKRFLGVLNRPKI
jgi:hypothetical protein